MTQPFRGAYAGRTVLVTGHTGFKGAWLAHWLTHLGARVVGYALDPPSQPSCHGATRLAERIVDLRGDVRDPVALARVLSDHKPSMVFHLAAQSLVRQAYADPRGTFDTNVMGTVTVLDAACRAPGVEAVVSVTSDKCYENQEWAWGYREVDRLGGHEPYGASKACAELALAVFRDPRFQARAFAGTTARTRPLPIGAGRAGNVIGGGDWAADRLLPDIVRAIAAGRDVVIRSPRATRPWQHVLEALSGYLWLGSRLLEAPERHAESYNFGPGSTAVGVTVEDIVHRILARWPGPSRLVVEEDRSGAEAGLLRLDCSRAESELAWRATWTVDETLERLVEWYRAFYDPAAQDLAALTTRQIDAYASRARELGIAWARDDG